MPNDIELVFLVTSLHISAPSCTLHTAYFASLTMAESAPAADTTPTSNGVTEKHQKPKPEKPDEEKYKTELAKAEKEHAIAMERMVCCTYSHIL